MVGVAVGAALGAVIFAPAAVTAGLLICGIPGMTAVQAAAIAGGTVGGAMARTDTRTD